MSSSRRQQFFIFYLVCVTFSLIFSIVRIYNGYNKYTVRGISMEPTLFDGNQVFVDRSRVINKGNIVVLKDPESKSTLIKRCIGVPNDTVRKIISKYKFPKSGYIMRTGKLSYTQLIDFFNYSSLNSNQIQKISPFTYKLSISDLNKAQLIALDSNIVFTKLQGDNNYSIYKQSIIPNDYYCFVGDNELNSVDSRSFGLVHKNLIIGVVDNIIKKN